MATIKPFCALHPNPFYADKLVFPANEQVFFFDAGQNELPVLSLKEQLEAPARKRPETEDGQQQAYKTIRENLQKLLEQDRLRKDDSPGIYIYEIAQRNYRQTGIWALTDLSDFTDGKIKLHELTLADSERRIGNYRENTGLEGSPVLLTYKPSVAINRIIAETCANNKKTTVGSKKSLHRIWKIEDPATLKRLMDAFKQVECAYMADGHHRLAGTAKLAAAKGDSLISSLYIATDQLRVCEYYRVVIPEVNTGKDILLKQLGSTFKITASKDNQPVKPQYPHVFGACIDGQWFGLEAPQTGENQALLLQQKVMAPFFQIIDPRTDARLKCIGGENAMDETLALLRAVPEAIAFTLCPLSVEELIAAADSWTILPPKSTWIDPKTPYGLLLVQHSIQTDHLFNNNYD